MPRCPACHADLEGSAALQSGATACPFCGADLSGLDLPAPLDDSARPRPLPRTSSPLPDKSLIQVVESTPQRLVLHVPPGGSSTAGIGCFALFWNGFMCLFTPPWLFGLGKGGGEPWYFIIPFLGLFWAIGLGMAYFWVRMKKLRTYLLVEPERVVMQQDLFGRKSTQETRLIEGSRASQVEAYSVNDRPVYAVVVQGPDRALKFGTQLSQPEKDWLVEAINGFLTTDDVPGVPAFCSACGEKLPANELDVSGGAVVCPACGAKVASVSTPAERVLPDVTPGDIPPGSMIEIEESSVDRLRFSLPAMPPGGARTGCALVVGLIGLAWAGSSGMKVVRELAAGPARLADFVSLLFSVLFLLPGLAVLFLAWTARYGRIRVSLDHDWLAVRWGWGPLGYTKRVATPSIERVRLAWSSSNAPDKRPPSASAAPTISHDVLVATVHVGASSIPLTTFHSPETAGQVAGLVKTQLEALGVRLTEG